jgi:hypothetical protein
LRREECGVDRGLKGKRQSPLRTSRTEKIFWKGKIDRKDGGDLSQFMEGRCQISLREGAKEWERRSSRKSGNEDISALTRELV